MLRGAVFSWTQCRCEADALEAAYI